jgi:hypothetical protein
LNGAFGIGKTTVARELCRLLPRAALFDPEWIGFVLRRLPGYRRSDYQELATWRRGTVLGARAFGLARPCVVVPMAFSDAEVLTEIRGGLAASGRPVLHFCLVAPLETVRARLAARGEAAGDPRHAWVYRRAAECVAAHAHDAFATHVPAVGTPDQIADELAARILTYAARD